MQQVLRSRLQFSCRRDHFVVPTTGEFFWLGEHAFEAFRENIPRMAKTKLFERPEIESFCEAFGVEVTDCYEGEAA